MRQYQALLLRLPELIISDSQPSVVVLMTTFFWKGRERAKTPIDLYEHQGCLWNDCRKKYKHVSKELKANEENGMHCGSTGMACTAASFTVARRNF